MSHSGSSQGQAAHSLPIEKMSTHKKVRSGQNRAHLSQRIVYDVASAAVAGSLIAPLITMIDKGIIENVSGRATLGDSIRNSFRTLLFRPSSYFISKPFGLIYLLYTSTYISANLTDTIQSTLRNAPASSTTPTTSKFLATSATNMSLSLVKDSAFTKLFGPARSISLPSRAVPLPTYLLFGSRDALTIFASFIAPPALSQLFPQALEDKLSISRMSMAQFVGPAAIQVFSTPLHLLGLDLYNRPNGKAGARLAWSSRASKVAADWAKSTGMRIARIVPAFGVGGVVNTKVRKTLMGTVEG